MMVGCIGARSGAPTSRLGPRPGSGISVRQARLVSILLVAAMTLPIALAIHEASSGAGSAATVIPATGSRGGSIGEVEVQEARASLVAFLAR